MKNAFKLVLLSLGLLVLACFNMQGAPKAYAYSPARMQVNQTIFMVDAVYIASTSNGTFIFDRSDNCLKYLNNDYSASATYSVQGEILDISSLDNLIYLLTNTGLIIFDTETCQFSFMEITLNGQTKISSSKLSHTNVLCIYSENIDQDESTTDVLYTVIDADAEKSNSADGNSDNSDKNGTTVYANYPTVSSYTFNKITFTGNQITTNANISHISFLECGDNTYIMLAYDKSLSAYPVDLNGDITTSGNTPVLSPEITGQDSAIIGMSTLNNCDLIVSYSNITLVYDATLTRPTDASSIKLELINSVSHSLDGDNLVATDMSACDNCLTVLGDNSYLEIDLSTCEVVGFQRNPACKVVARSSKDYKYYKLNSSSSLIMSPDSKESTIINVDGDDEKFVVEVADVYLPDDTLLQGYKYVMYTYKSTLAEVNTFGYILTTDQNLLTSVDTQDVSTSTVKVNNKTNLYTLPSVVTDNNNNIITTISANLPVKVLNYISDYKTPNGETFTNFALVEVDGKVGFIDTKEIVSSDKRILLVIPNAKLISGANIYEYDDTSSKVLHKLSQAKSVKILQSRNAKGFTKIAYNDDEGNYFEGYIVSSSVKPNSYTTLQIIGTVLVLLNVVFLVVLIATKRKVVK